MSNPFLRIESRLFQVSLLEARYCCHCLLAWLDVNLRNPATFLGWGLHCKRDWCEPFFFVNMAENQHYYWLPPSWKLGRFFKVLCSLKVPAGGRDDMPGFGGRVSYPGFGVIYGQELPPHPTHRQQGTCWSTSLRPKRGRVRQLRNFRGLAVKWKP